MTRIAFLLLLSTAPVFGVEINDIGYYTAIVNSLSRVCELHAEEVDPGGKLRLV